MVVHVPPSIDAARKQPPTHLQVLEQPRLVVVQVAQVHLDPELAPAVALEELVAVDVLPALAEGANELAVGGSVVCGVWYRCGVRGGGERDRSSRAAPCMHACI